MPIITITNPDTNRIVVTGDLTVELDATWEYDQRSTHTMTHVAISDGTLLRFAIDKHGFYHIACLHKGLADIEILEATHCVIMRTNLAAQFAWVASIDDYRYWER